MPLAVQSMGYVLPDNRSSKEFSHEKNTKAPEETTTGVTAGGLVGVTLG